jgi:hypothetical protein
MADPNDNSNASFPSPESVLALSERLRRRAIKSQREHHAESSADLRLASFHLRRLASLLLLREAVRASTQFQRDRLTQEAKELWCGQ